MDAKIEKNEWTPACIWQVHVPGISGYMYTPFCIGIWKEAIMKTKVTLRPLYP
jgi:hypothetical protein